MAPTYEEAVTAEPRGEGVESQVICRPASVGPARSFIFLPRTSCSMICILNHPEACNVDNFRVPSNRSFTVRSLHADQERPIRQLVTSISQSLPSIILKNLNTKWGVGGLWWWGT